MTLAFPCTVFLDGCGALNMHAGCKGSRLFARPAFCREWRQHRIRAPSHGPNGGASAATSPFTSMAIKDA